MIDYFSNAVRDLSRKKLRSLLTVFGIAVGVMSVVLITIISHMGQAAVREELADLGADGILITANSKKKQVQLTGEELAWLRQSDLVDAATPLMVDYSTVRMKNQSDDCVIWGVDQSVAGQIRLEVVHGRLLTAEDMRASAQVCLVDESYAQSVYQRTNIVGKQLEIRMDGVYRTFEVVGVIRSGGNLLQSLMGDVVPCFTYLPYTTMQMMEQKTDLGQIMVRTAGDSAAAARKLSDGLSERYGVGDAVRIQNLNSQMEMIESAMGLVSTVLTVIAGISLLVSGLSIMTVMLVSVSERTREIGIKKAIGATRRMILTEFLAESGVVTLVGAVLGTAAGVGLAAAGCALCGFPLVLPAGTIAGCILFAVLVGVLFGSYPAMKAASMKPVDALRQEIS